MKQSFYFHGINCWGIASCEHAFIKVNTLRTFWQKVTSNMWMENYFSWQELNGINNRDQEIPARHSAGMTSFITFRCAKQKLSLLRPGRIA